MRRVMDILAVAVLAFMVGVSVKAVNTARKDGNQLAVYSENKEDEADKSYIALIIDDFGYGGTGMEEMLNLDIDFTAAVMPFSSKSKEDMKRAVEAGKEVIIHMPMESKTGEKSWVGDKGVFIDMTEDEIKQVVDEAFEIVESAVGMNNHMGSAVMENEEILQAVMECIKERDMIFIDSLTTGKSKGKEIAEKNNVDFLQRNYFIDSPENIDIVINQLKKAASKAKENGYAVAIGHVGPAGGKTTAEAIKRTKDEIEKMGVEFITISKLNEIVNGSNK